MGICEYTAKLSAYHDGELPDHERRAVEAHVAGCPECSRELSGLRELSLVLSAAPVPEVPHDLSGRLRAGLRSSGEVEIIRICRVASMAAAALLVVCAVSLWGSEPSAPAQVQAPATWEVAAVTLNTDLAQADTDWSETFAQWVVADLSRENGS
jgi:anti-sigma factor RsiW